MSMDQRQTADVSIMLIDAIDDLLPQTQCGRCGHPGCRPYAEAIAAGEPLNRCPPGGRITIDALANLLERPPLPLDESYGSEQPRQIAVIRETECIGCTKCIQACPVDAIVGAAQLMHSVIANECTGCNLCIEPCPVDCIDMVAAEDEAAVVSSWPLLRARADHARQRYQTRTARLARIAAEQTERQQRKNGQTQTTAPHSKPSQADILAAVARSKAKRSMHPTQSEQK